MSGLWQLIFYPPGVFSPSHLLGSALPSTLLHCCHLSHALSPIILFNLHILTLWLSSSFPASFASITTCYLTFYVIHLMTVHLPVECKQHMVRIFYFVISPVIRKIFDIY